VGRTVNWLDSAYQRGIDWVVRRLHRVTAGSQSLDAGAGSPLSATPGSDDQPGLAASAGESPATAETRGASPPPFTTHVTSHYSASDPLARVDVSVEMPVGATVRVTIETAAGQEPVVSVLSPQRQLAKPLAGRQPAASAAPLGAAWRARVAVWRQFATTRVGGLPVVLFFGALLLYGVTHLIGLDRYPIYFFTDEAVHTVLARDFLIRGLRNSYNEFLPTYFSLGSSFNLNGVSVYVQVLPYLLFGKSEYVTRATSALVTIIAALSVGLILRDFFKRRYWWTASLLLAVTPAWFLHSRTAFEYVEVASFYAGFLYCYLRYRYISPRSLYGAIVFGALAFYTHGLGEVLMGVTAVLLGLVDWRYHWQQRALVGRGLLLVAVLALPYARYSLAHPSAFADQLRQRGSYWMDRSLSLTGKLTQFLSEYTYGLSPAFWFRAVNGRDIERHVMLGYGNLWLPTLPLLALGLVYALRNVCSAASRTVILALLAAPVGSALVAIGIPRMLWAIIPIALLTAIGLSLVLEWLEARHVSATMLALGAFVVLAGFNVYMLRDALVNGGLWSQDYTLAGTQFGARQVFGEAIPEYLAQHPDTQFIVSGTWANGTDMFVPFFLTPQQISHVQLQSLDYFLTARRDLAPNLVVVLTAREYDQAVQDPKLANIAVDRIVPYPNGQPGFYFLHLDYSPQAGGLFAAEHAQLLVPVVETYNLDGQNVTVTHPRFGAGQLHDMLDGDPYTLINSPSFNPLVLDFAFPAPRTIRALTLITGALPDFTVTVTLDAGGNVVIPGFGTVIPGSGTGTGTAPQVYTQHYVGLPPDPTVRINFDQGPAQVMRLHLEIHDNANTGPGVNIHVREVQFR
jgi:hypothetical protein